MTPSLAGVEEQPELPLQPDQERQLELPFPD